MPLLGENSTMVLTSDEGISATSYICLVRNAPIDRRGSFVLPAVPAYGLRGIFGLILQTVCLVVMSYIVGRIQMVLHALRVYWLLHQENQVP